MNNRVAFIYGLFDPDTGYCRYVGRTVLSPKRRLDSHIYGALNGKKRTPSSCWVRTIIERGSRPEIDVLEEVTVSTMHDAEIFWISYLRFVGCHLLNVTDGGRGSFGFKMPEEECARRSKRFRGVPQSAELVAKRAIALRGRTPSEKCLEAAKLATTGVPLSDDHKAKLSAALRGRAISTEHKRKIGAAHKGRVKSPSEIEKMSMGARAASVRRCAGVCKTSNGGKWRALIFVDGKQLHLGTFATMEMAAAVRKAAEAKYWGAA